MITIDDLPANAPLACAECCEPLTWVWVHHLARNIAVIPLRDVDRFSFRIHTCRMTPERVWRHVQIVPREVAIRGARRARAVLAAKQKLNEKEGGQGVR